MAATKKGKKKKSIKNKELVNQTKDKSQKNKKEVNDSVTISTEKSTSDDKKARKAKKNVDLLSKRGIPKFWATLIIETIYILVIEVIFKALLGNLNFDWILLRIFVSSNILALLVTLITTNLAEKLRKTILMIFNLFVSFYAWIQMGFMNFLGAFMSIGNAEQGTKITDYIVEFLAAYELKLHTLIIPFILIVVYFCFERYITRDGFEKKIDFKNVLKNIALFIYLVLLVFSYYVTIEVDFMQNKFQTVSNKELFKYPSNPSVAIKNFGTTVYFGLDVKGTVFGSPEINYTSTENKNTAPEVEEDDNRRKIDDEAWDSLVSMEKNQSYISLNDYFKNREIKDMNEYTGLFEDKNLIMIMMESIGYAIFNPELAEYFPTLHKLYNEGISAENNFSPRNNCATGESELTSQTGLYSISTTCTVNTYKANEYKQAIQYMMRNNGYYTSSYHNYTDQYYSRSTIEYKLGSYRFYGAKDLQIAISPAYKEWPSDIELMEKAIPKFINEDRFMTHMVTVSAHTPYIYSSGMGNKHLALFKDLNCSTPLKRYLSKVKELDLALEYLLKELETAGKLDDTVLVLFGDHYPYALSDKEYSAIAHYSIDDGYDVDRTPFIIYNSGIDAEKITKYMTPVDYAPTILNLFNIEYDPRLYLGNDVFSEYTDYVVFSDNSWKNANGYYNSDKGMFVSNSEENILTDEQIIAINEEVNELRTMSGLAIKKNYFNYLFKYFEDYENQKIKQELEKQNESSSGIVESEEN